MRGTSDCASFASAQGISKRRSPRLQHGIGEFSHGVDPWEVPAATACSCSQYYCSSYVTLTYVSETYWPAFKLHVKAPPNDTKDATTGKHFCVKKIFCIYIYIYGCAPAGPPPPSPPWYPVMYSYTSMSNGRHGVFSPPPPPPCGTGYPSASAASPSPTAAVLCSASCGIPVLWFSNCACGPGRKENPPPPPRCGTGWFSLLPYTHTHTMSL